MAQDTALLLRGLGAAFANRIPQLRQELAQEQEAKYLQQQREDQARKQQYERQEAINSAFAQDVMQGQQLLKQGNFQALFDLSRSTAQSAELLGLPTRPPAEIAMLASKAMAGDSQAITQLEQRLGSYAQQYQRYMPKTERDKGVVVGNALLNPYTGAVMGQAPTQQGLLTKSEVESLISQGYSGLDPTKQYQRSASGTISELGGGGTTINVGTATEGERKAGTLANRLDYAMSQVQEVLSKSPEATSPELVPSLLSGVGLEMLANMANSPQRRAVEAAQRDMLDAALTLGTGAAYTKEQLEGYRVSYFPQIGDDPEVIRYKANRLKNLIDTAYDAAGRAKPEQRLSGQSGATGSVIWSDLKD